MKNSIMILTLFLFLLNVSSDNNAQNKKVGLGIIVGEPTGLSAKLWLNGNNALALGLGWSVEGYRFNGVDDDYDKVTRTHLHIDYLWHSFYAISSNGQFPLYYGLGGRINTGPVYGGTFGIRALLGVAWLPRSTPLDIFFEIAPTLLLVNSTGFGIDAGIGARFFL
jgi:hypothetical protein